MRDPVAVGGHDVPFWLSLISASATTTCSGIDLIDGCGKDSLVERTVHDPGQLPSHGRDGRARRLTSQKRSSRQPWAKIVFSMG